MLSTGERENKHLGAEYLAVVETNHGNAVFPEPDHQGRAHTIVLGANRGNCSSANFLLTKFPEIQPAYVHFRSGGSYEATTETSRAAICA